MISKLKFILIVGLLPFALWAEEPELSEADKIAIQQAIEAYDESPWELAIAAGYGVRTTPLADSEDTPLYLVVDFAWFGDWFFFDNGDLGVAVHESEKLSVNIIAHINNERSIFEWFNNESGGISFLPESLSSSLRSIGANYFDSATGLALESNEINEFSSSEQDFSALSINDDDSIQVIPVDEPVTITDRNIAVDGGLELIYSDDWGDLQLQMLSDLSFTHKGFEVWASYSYFWRHKNWRITPSFGINWKSSNLLDYYYGVRPEEIRHNRPAYQASSGFNSFARLSVSYQIDENWGIVGVAEYENLSRSIRRSPLVDRSSSETLFIGVMYRF